MNTAGLNIFEAKRLAQQGWHVRRSGWVADSTTPVAGLTKKVTRWLAMVRGIWYNRPTDGSAARVVEEPADIAIADLRAADWTILDASGNIPPPPKHPNPGNIDPSLPELPTDLPAGSSSSSSGGSSGSGSGVGSGFSGGGGGSGDGGDGDDDPDGGGSRPHRPDRAAPAVNLTVERIASGCVDPLLPGDRSDSFTWEVSLEADPDALMGEVWFVNVGHGTPTGWKTVLNGTLSPGGASQSGTFSIVAAPGQKFTVQAKVHLSGVGLNNQASKPAKMLGFCGIVPHITGFNISPGGLTNTTSFTDHGSNGPWTITPVWTGSPTGVSYVWKNNVGVVVGSGATFLAPTHLPGGGVYVYDCLISNAFDSDGLAFNYTVLDP